MTPARGAAASPLAEMPSQPPHGYTGGTPALSAQRVSNVPRYVMLLDWWLERLEGSDGKIRVAGFTQTPQMRHFLLLLLHFSFHFCSAVAFSTSRRGASSSKGNRQSAGRVFRSSAIVGRKDDAVIEAEDGYLIRICRVLNIPQTRDNGFSQEVCERFEFGFPIEWQRFVNPNMEPDNEHAHKSSESSQPPANASSCSAEYYVEKFLSDSFIYSGHALSEIEYASWGLFGLRMDMPEEHVKPHGEICNICQENGQCESMQIDASEQEMVTLPNDSVIVEHLNSKTSDLGSVNLGTAYASPLPAEGVTSQFGAVQGSEDNTARRLRNGKVLGMPRAEAERKKRGHKQKKVQHESVPDKVATSTADLTSHENVGLHSKENQEQMEAGAGALKGLELVQEKEVWSSLNSRRILESIWK
ncbi:hypothetical protein U9M48_010740 [Paspalum notatum var. saurae]|uniref:SANTA domain-containing protein n=1 Tax=Paspalum notatum var. saurae TaxID=547442 RepID=A0AAQ3SVN7_PASNO